MEVINNLNKDKTESGPKMSKTRELIGYTMTVGNGFTVFINGNGGLSIKQDDWENSEHLIVLTPYEAAELIKAMQELVHACGPMMTPIDLPPKD